MGPLDKGQNVTFDEIETHFADLRRCTSVEEIAEWLSSHSDVLYANGRRYTNGAPETPTWQFESLKFSQTFYATTPPYISTDLLMKIKGNDPCRTMRRMLETSCRNMAISW